MINILLVTFAISLIYMGIANRLSTYINILALQGVILFGVSFIELIQINTLNLIFILFETIVFKTIAIPMFLKYVIEKNKIVREAEPFLPDFLSVVVITGIILGSFILSNVIEVAHLRKMFFIVAISASFTGLFIIISRKKVVTHIIGYLVIENGVFLLSLSAGNKMPMLVNTGITLDIFVSVLVLGIFVNRIGNTFEEMNVDNLTKLKD
jgi:hydrogenase-4 component E